MNPKSKPSDKVKKTARKKAKEFLLNRLEKAKKSGKGGNTGQTEAVAETAVRHDALEGGVFLDGVDDLMDRDEVFGFLMIKTDASHHSDGGDVDPATPSTAADGIADVVASVCENGSGFWGEIESGLFGCYLPGLDDRDALKVSQKIRQVVNGRKNGSVSIGVAAYPTLEYAKRHILENAQKALVHAAFFGSDSIVVFDAVSLNISGDVLYQTGDISGAAKEFKMGLKLNPEDENLHNSLGVCYGELGDLEGALAAFEKAAGISPDNVMALHNAGYAKSMLGDAEGALTYFLKADQLDGSLFEVVFHTGKLYVETGRPAKGKPFLERAVRLNPEFGAAHFYLGECFRELKQRNQAMASYKQAVKRNPSDAGSLSVLGVLYDEKGENPEISLMFCENSVAISPDNSLYLTRLGELYEKHDDLPKALGMFERASLLGEDVSGKIEALKAMSANEDAELEKEKDVFPVSRVATKS